MWCGGLLLDGLGRGIELFGEQVLLPAKSLHHLAVARDGGGVLGGVLQPRIREAEALPMNQGRHPGLQPTGLQQVPSARGVPEAHREAVVQSHDAHLAPPVLGQQRGDPRRQSLARRELGEKIEAVVLFTIGAVTG